jgi:hypothetical protein
VTMTTAEHEAAHAAACMVLGLPVVSVDALGDGKTYAGLTRHGVHGVRDTREVAFKLAIVLAAPCVRGRGGD